MVNTSRTPGSWFERNVKTVNGIAKCCHLFALKFRQVRAEIAKTNPIPILYWSQVSLSVTRLRVKMADTRNACFSVRCRALLE
jgi:hypothetical protein